MLKLGSVRALLVDQRGVVLDNASLDEVAQLYVVSDHSPEAKAMVLTPSRYFSCPILSKYRRHHGRVPKFFLMTLSSGLAEATRRPAVEASGFKA